MSDVFPLSADYTQFTLAEIDVYDIEAACWSYV